MNDRFPLALPENTVLAGQYIIQNPLGQGGFGITYKAIDRMTGKFVAVKEYFPESMATRLPGKTDVTTYSGDRGENFVYGKRCFVQEAETLAQFIGNENIVRIYSYFEEYGTAYFVMDYIEGTPLDEFVKQHGGKLSFEEAADILVPVMDALGAVHDKGIVHRDVSPDNIYITRDGMVKLIDFGAARQSLGDKSQSLDVILKHGFAPKEQYMRRGKQGPFTDIYALGATFYFVLTGKRPPDALERADEDEIILPSTLGVKISRDAEEAILIALSVQPQDRFQSMAAFKNAMLFVRNEETKPILTTSSTSSTKSDTRAPIPDSSRIPALNNALAGSQKNSKERIKKKPAILGVCAAVLACIVLFMAKTISSEGGDSVDNPVIIGNEINNLSNGSGIITKGPLSGKTYLDTSNGGIPFRCLSMVDGVAYALRGRTSGEAVTFDAGDEREIKNATAIPELSGFSNITRLYVSKKYYYIFTADQLFYCVNRADGSVKQSMFSGFDYHEFTFTESGKFCYIDWSGEHGNWTIYFTPAGKIDDISEVYYMIPDSYSGSHDLNAEIFSGENDEVFVYLSCPEKELNKLYKFNLNKDPEESMDVYEYPDQYCRQLLNTDGSYVYCGYFDNDTNELLFESMDLDTKNTSVLYNASNSASSEFDCITVYPDKKGNVSVLVNNNQLDLSVK